MYYITICRLHPEAQSSKDYVHMLLVIGSWTTGIRAFYDYTCMVINFFKNSNNKKFFTLN